jgi:hypothetical protein
MGYRISPAAAINMARSALSLKESFGIATRIEDFFINKKWKTPINPGVFHVRAAYEDAYCYFSWPLTVANVLDSFVPIVVAAPIIATLMSAAMRPYSIAVAPVSSSRKRAMRVLFT